MTGDAGDGSKMVRAGCALAIFAAAVAGSGCVSASATGREVSVADPADGAVVELAPGDVLVLRLTGHAGTGFQWTGTPADPAVLALAGSGDEVAAPGLPGGPTTRVLRFRAVAPGRTALDVRYARPWEGGVPPARAARLDVRVR